ncbi:MAG TPA: PASTA domain-containing protein [Bacteroidales bacterium]|jgi:beta-lactam-binding protein with PASTA domain|nr:PASTA domain-containing protein [Bacteroidales bacterium]MDI9533654.1 PASTA domain-containing protein [Bacteroidota bacterium]OPZ58245.1 MAG: Serine/threonine-protein kinase PrkC [Bacteroidetes bacterium ADurb.BinA012]MBK7732482.1 PASTA domain-containing protein [Bacteroidales bacterium]MBP7036563.1 PASTA domain-containing protein [Bacteroidales bacterium]
MSVKEFFKSRVFWKQVGLAMVIGVAIIIVLIIWLNIYTRHGQARPTPEVRGLTITEAQHVVSKNRMKLQIIDSVYTTMVPRGCVAEQTPLPGHRVKKGRTIKATINAFNPEMVAVPDLVGLPRRQALSMIETAGLQVGQLNYVADLTVDFVLKQTIHGREALPGDSVQKGMVIDLVLGRGLSSQRTSVPRLTGLTLDEARNEILGASLNLGAFVFDGTVITRDDSLSAFVFKQNPEYHDEASVQLGSAVYIWLTTDSLKMPADTITADILLPEGDFGQPDTGIPR